MTDLQSNKTDYIVSVIKGAAGAVPFVGSAIQEMLTDFIPGQRADRIAKFLQEIGERVAKLEEIDLRKRLSNPERVEILQEGMIRASHAVSEERLQYLANLAGQGINDETIDFSKELHFSRMLSELTDVEVIILRFYLYGDRDGDHTFREKNSHIYSVPAISHDSTDEETEEGAIRMSYRVHLTSLGLLRLKNSLIDTKNPMNAQYAITSLGIMLLMKIGLVVAYEEAPNAFF